MQPKLALEFLNECERRFPVEDWQFRNFRIWPIVRSLIGIALWHPKSQHAKVPDFETRLRRRLSSAVLPLKDAWVYARDRSHHQGLLPTDAVFLSKTSARQDAGGTYYDVHCDALRDGLRRAGKRSLHLEYTQPGMRLRLPRYQPSHLVTVATVTAGFASLLTPHAEPSAAEELVDAEFLEFVRSRVGPVAGFAGRQLFRRLAYIDSLSKHFAAILQRVQARAAFVVCYYTPVSASLVLAATRLGIPVIDIQHGVIASHFMYDGWSRLPERGYGLLPTTFWTWTDEDKAIVDTWVAKTGSRIRTICGGNPADAFWASAASDLSLLFHQRLRAVRDRHSSAIHVLLTLQWDCGLTELLKQLMLRSGEQYYWWVRLHPTMSAEASAIEKWVQSQLEGRANVREASTLPLPLLLQHVDLHVTRHSTVIDDARRAGISSVALDAVACDKFSAAAQSGFMRYAASVPEALSAMAALSSNLAAAAATPALGPSPPQDPATLRLEAGVRQLCELFG